MEIRIDKDEYDNRCDYLRDIGYVNSLKYRFFGHLPKDFGTHTDNRECEGSHFYAPPPQAPKFGTRAKQMSGDNLIKLTERFLKLPSDSQKRFVITIIFNLLIARYPESGEKSLDEQLKSYEKKERLK